MKVEWFDNRNIAWAFARSQFFRVKRTGYVRYLNLLVNLIVLPLLIPGQLLTLLLLVVTVVAWMFSRVFRKSNETFSGKLTRYLTIAGPWLSRFPTSFLTNAINNWRTHPRRRRFFDNRPPILYLRPFKMDNRVAVTPNNAPLTLEYVIRNMTSSIGPLIALGRTDTTETASRAGRIQVPDEMWKEEVTALMHSSGHIVLVPEDTDGTIWEITQILEDTDLLKKTIFMNIAAAGRDHPYWSRERTVYSDDDGKVFMETLTRMTQPDAVAQIPLTQIAGAALIKGEVHVFCAERLFDAGLWSALPRIVIFLRSQSGV